ncbi:MAG: hypothetical protein OEV00_15885 [Acidobacteriota bacterium]|nr:hypothetical protein [Acidobacteriota bacterium]
MSGSLLLVMIAFVGMTAAQEKPVYVGCARIFNGPTATVVYPASDPGTMDTNRFSAERKTAYLREIHGVDARVVADTDFDPTATPDNLLILGWDNLLLPRIAESQFLSHNGVSGTFMNGITIAPGEDLLFARRSTLSDDHRVIFWSRIDPELDRFYVVPFVASDFAVFEGYRIQHQGNYANWDAVPPTRDEAAEMEFRTYRGSAVRMAEGEQHEIFVNGGTDTKTAEAILAARTQALADIQDRLGSRPLDARIKVYVYPDLPVKLERTNVPNTTHSIPRLNEIHLLQRHALSETAHEDLHVVAHQRYGPCLSTALYEGFALAYEQDGHQTTLDTVAAHLFDEEQLPSIHELLDEESFRVLAREGTGFAVAALLVQWLRAQFDEPKFAQAYTVERPGVETLAAALGTDATALEAGFRAHLNGLAEGAMSALAFQRAVAESQHHRDTGNDEAARAAMGRALEAQPDDAGTLYGLGLMDLEAGRTDEGVVFFRRLLELGLPTDSRYRIFAHFQLANAYRTQKQTGKATRELKRMLALPDLYDSHGRAESMLESLRKEKKSR